VILVRMSDSIRLGSVALECPDAGQLAAFYAEITGGTVTSADKSMQMHLDFLVDDADAAEARVLAAGATKFDFQPGDHFRVYADPAGHPFCLCIAPTAS
jgi:predicted enzyme related to lactoylglutathione lyase